MRRSQRTMGVVVTARATVAVCLLAAIAAIAACEADPDADRSGNTSATTAPPPVDGAPSAPTGACQPPRAGPVDPGSVLVPGPTNGLAASAARGQPLVIVAVVLDRACAPATGAEL